MKEHLDTHCTSFKCPRCNYVFGVESSYFEHINVCNESLTVSRQIVDSIIDLAVDSKEVFSRKQIYKETKVSKDCISQFVCCEKIYTNFAEFNTHKFVVHQVEHLNCGLCNFEATIVSILYNHYKGHFPNEKLCIWLKKPNVSKSAKEADLEVSRSIKTELSDNKDECLGEEEDENDSNVSCIAQQEGIMCQCFSCTKLIDSYQSTNHNEQVKKADSIKPYACNICTARFFQISRLKRHLKTHLGVKAFPCDVCGSSFTVKTSLKTHILMKHSSRNPFSATCSTCLKVFANKNSLNKHISNVHLKQGKNLRVQCSYCSKSFANSKNLKRHVNEQHLQKIEFVCYDCGRVFYDKTVLTSHIQYTHLPSEPCVCDVCGYSARNKLLLDTHRHNQHSKIQFNCEVCGKIFKNKHAFEKHQITHTDEKPYGCGTCGKCFKREANLVQHSYSHSDERPHSCAICGLTFRLRTHIKQHMAVHGLLRTHKCHLCSEVFARKGELNLHLVKHGY